MYSKITHNVVEEHFAHPSPNPHNPHAGQTHVGGTGMLSTLPDGSLRFNDPLPYYVLSEATMLFRMDSRTLWSKYAWGLLNYSIALNTKLPDVGDVLNRLISYATNLGDFISPYYGITAGTSFGQKLTAIANTGTQVSQAILANAPLTTLQAQWQAQIQDLTLFLNTLNPNNWPQSLLTDMFTNMVTFWSQSMAARAAGDSAATDLAISNLSKLVITGVTNSSPTHKASSLADVFSRGMIAQFPELFAN
jgi:hypothetical protein